jgi:hypothetical protein
MIITDRLVFAHFPKNGGTFVRTVLRDLHNHYAPNRLWKRAYNRLLGGRSGRDFRELNQHRTCQYIPQEDRDKPILSSIRHPFDRYISQFFYGWWRTRLPNYCYPERALDRYPHFPELSFAEFLDLSSREFGRIFNPNVSTENRMGWYSRSIIQFYYKDPYHAYHNVDDAYINARRWERDMTDVHFLTTSNLNEELYAFLTSVGYEEDDVQFVLDLEKIRPAQAVRDRKGRTVEDMFTPDLKAFVRRKDRLVFEMFPQFQQQYA